MDKPTNKTKIAGRSLPCTSTDIALVAVFGALITVCALVPAIPVKVLLVPITLQTFGVLLAGAVLGPLRGALATALYLALGFANLPVFAGGASGLQILGKPSGGFLIGFPIGAAITGAIVYLYLRKHTGNLRPGGLELVIGLAALAGTVGIYAFGLPLMGLRLGLNFTETLLAGAVFIPGDLVKVVLVAIVGAAAHRAYRNLAK